MIKWKLNKIFYNKICKMLFQMQLKIVINLKIDFL